MAKRNFHQILLERIYYMASPETSVFDLVNLFVKKNHITAISIINDKEELSASGTDADLLYKR